MRIQAERYRKATGETEHKFVPTSPASSPRPPSSNAAISQHWGIENKLH